MNTPLDAPSGTPFIGTICGSLPQLIVRTPHAGQEQWWFLNGDRWLRTDDEDVTITGRLVPDPEERA